MSLLIGELGSIDKHAATFFPTAKTEENHCMHHKYNKMNTT